MIQSDIFDSSNMNIKKLANKALEFSINRLIEISGILIVLIGILLLISLVSYSPEDPNFIFPDNTKIKNLLGFQGSYISDIFFQSIGLISYLISFTLFFSGLNIFFNKNFLLIIENIFYAVLYSIFGSIFGFTGSQSEHQIVLSSWRARSFSPPNERGLCPRPHPPESSHHAGRHDRALRPR